MISLDSLSIMTEEEKLDIIRRLSESEEWNETFEPIYAALMDDESPAVRQAAIVALWDLADPRHIEPLIRKAEHDPDVEVRAKAASVLGIYIYEGLFGEGVSESHYLAVRKLLIDLAQDANEAMIVRRMAIEALSFDTEEPIQDLLEWAYHHPSIEVKMTALFAMGRSRNAAWFDTILRELDSEDHRLQLEAVNAAAEAEIGAATPKLRNLVASADRQVGLAAIWALAHTRGPGALETLEMCAESDDEEIRQVALEAVDVFYDTEEEETEDESESEDDEEDDL